MDPYCTRCEVFHPRATPCEDVLERRAKVVPIFIHQMRLNVDESICRQCGGEYPVTDLNAAGRCATCAPPCLDDGAPVEDLLAESLRARGVTPRTIGERP